jgi:hypothetical protein
MFHFYGGDEVRFLVAKGNPYICAELRLKASAVRVRNEITLSILQQRNKVKVKKVKPSL